MCRSGFLEFLRINYAFDGAPKAAGPPQNLHQFLAPWRTALLQAATGIPCYHDGKVERTSGFIDEIKECRSAPSAHTLVQTLPLEVASVTLARSSFSGFWRISHYLTLLVAISFPAETN
jgi:hypothetical protein